MERRVDGVYVFRQGGFITQYLLWHSHQMRPSTGHITLVTLCNGQPNRPPSLPSAKGVCHTHTLVSIILLLPSISYYVITPSDPYLLFFISFYFRILFHLLSFFYFVTIFISISLFLFNCPTHIFQRVSFTINGTLVWSVIRPLSLVFSRSLAFL